MKTPLYLFDKDIRMRPTFPKRGKCLACDVKLGLFRKLSKKRFCSNDHELKYLTELKEIAVMRLRSAGLRLDADAASDIDA